MNENEKKNRKKTKFVGIFLSEEEFELVNKMSEKKHLPKSRYLFSLVLQEANNEGVYKK